MRMCLSCCSWPNVSSTKWHPVRSHLTLSASLCHRSWTNVLMRSVGDHELILSIPGDVVLVDLLTSSVKWDLSDLLSGAQLLQARLPAQPFQREATPSTALHEVVLEPISPSSFEGSDRVRHLPFPMLNSHECAKMCPS